MEEDIKILEELKNVTVTFITDKERQAIENLIKGYREYKNFYHRRLKEWRKKFENQEKHFLNELDEYDEEREKLKKQLEDSIPKSKIKDMIEEYEKLIKEVQDNEEHYNEIPLYEHDIEVLQELMEDK